MDIASLPEEMLREIFSFLPFKDLLHCSLICVRWHCIAESLIYRRACVRIGIAMVGQGQVLWEGARQYHTVIVDNPPCSRRSLVNLLMLPCMVIFKPKEVQLRNFVEESLHKFCRHGHRLFEQAETVCIELNDERHNYPHDDVEEFIFSFPQMRHLAWDQYSLSNGRHTMIVDAPLLQKVVFEDSLDANTSALHVIGCDQLQHVKCLLRSKRFENIFGSCFRCLQMLSLDIRNQQSNLSLPKELPMLRWLEISVCEELTSNIIEDICGYSKLEGLKLIVFKHHEQQRSRVNINHLFSSLLEVESIELSGLCIDAYNTMAVHNLKLLKMKHIKLANPVLLFDAPKLSILSICDVNLANVSFINNGNHLKKLFVELTDPDWKHVLNVYLQPFLQVHDSIEQLALISSTISTDCNAQLDSSFFDQPVLHVESLFLHKLKIGCNFMEQCRRWGSLKRLNMNDCHFICNCKMMHCGEVLNSAVHLRLNDAPEIIIKRNRPDHSRSNFTYFRNYINPL